MDNFNFNEFFKDSSDRAQESPADIKYAIRACRFAEARAMAESALLQKRLIMQEFRPSRFYPVSMHHDGFRWVCRYVAGPQAMLEDVTDGVEAYGDSPEGAMSNFDLLWIGDSNKRSSETEECDGEGI